MPGPYGRLVNAATDPLSPYAAVVLAGGRAARLGGRAKPQLQVGGRTMLATVLDAVADARPRVVVGPSQPVADGVVLVREQPPGGGPVAAMRTGVAAVDTDVVAVLAGDLPFVTAALVREQPPRGGPVAALRAGLAHVEADVVAVLAGDLPFLTAGLVRSLRERLPAQADLQRLLGRDGVRSRAALVAADAQHRRPARHSSHGCDGNRLTGGTPPTAVPSAP